MIDIQLDCSFGDFRLFVDKKLPSDQIVGLFGASGSGKSRFIRQLLGFDDQFLKSGKISLEEQCWLNSESKYSLDTAQRGIGYLPQSYDLFPHMTVLENIQFPIGKGIKTSHTLDIDSMMQQLDIDSLSSRLPEQLSGGQKQRVALARAIVAASRILILDEPLSAQGETHRTLILKFLKNLNRQYQIPIILASHNRIEHAFLSQYLVTFSLGKINQSGNYDQIAYDINGSFAQTSDAINHISASVVSYQKEFYLNQLKTKEHQLWAGDEQLPEGSEVELEVRAQDISLSLSRDNSSSILNCLSVKIIAFKEIARHQYLIKLAFEDCHLTTFITKKSFFELKLKENIELFALFKSVSVLPIGVDQQSTKYSVERHNRV